MCELCKNTDKPFKYNTHYLTDYIIKTALNEDGSSLRGKGLYFNVDPQNPVMDMEFQQHASPEKLEDMFGRQTNDEENLESIENTVFSVDDKFCKDCEDIFGVIETKFLPLLKCFRIDDLTDKAELVFNENESKIIRLFFLMQVWRTAICDEDFHLSNAMMERLRLKILNQDYDGLEQFPLSVTYMDTLDEEGKKSETGPYTTDNIVEAINGDNPNLIYMNDFYIQFYEDLDFPFEKLFGLNDEEDYQDYINYQNNEFKMKVFSNDERKAQLYKMHLHNAPIMINEQRQLFRSLYKNHFGTDAPVDIEDTYIKALTEDPDILKFSTEKLNMNFAKFIEKL